MAEKESLWMERVEIDTSAPFQSVKEAVDLFGGRGSWKPRRNCRKSGFSAEMHPCFEANISVVEEQTKQLKNDIVVKEQETLEVLKEIESTKRIMDELKLKLHNQVTEASISSHRNLDSGKILSIIDNEEEISSNINPICSSAVAKSSRLMLMELKKAKANLNRTMNDLSGYRSSFAFLNNGIEEERLSLENIHERQGLNATKMSFLEKEPNKTRLMLDRTKDAGASNEYENAFDLSRKLEPRSDTSHFNDMIAGDTTTEAVKMSEKIEQTKDSMLHAAIKMEDTTKATEVIGLAETKAPIDDGEHSPTLVQCSPGATKRAEDYNVLAQKPEEAEELCKKRIEAAMLQVQEAKTKMELLKTVEEAKADISNSRKALEEAIQKVEAAHRGKLLVDVEDAHWKRRPKHGQRRRSINRSPRRFKNSPKFKNSSSMSQRKREFRVCDGCEEEVFRPTLSIGQILRRKLMGPEEYETKSQEPEVSLRELLSRQRAFSLRSSDGAAIKQLQVNKKKFGFKGFSLVLAKL